MAKPKFTAPLTIFLGVEGEDEEALCLYLKEFTRGKGRRIEVKNLHGGSSDSQATQLRNYARVASYDEVWLLTDADKPLTKAGKRDLDACTGQVILSRPCLEGEHLQLLGQTVPPNALTQDCIRRLGKHYGLPGEKELKAHFAEREHWRKVFSLENLKSLRSSNPWLEQLLTLFAL